MKSIIYITSRRLLPLNSGDKILTFNILKRLSKIYNIHLFNLNDGDTYTHEEMLIINKLTTSFKTVQFNNQHSLFKILKTLFSNQMYWKIKTYDKHVSKELNKFIHMNPNVEYILWDHLRSSLFFSPNQLKNFLIEHNNEADIIMGRAKKVRIPFIRHLIEKQAELFREYVEHVHNKMDRIIYLNENDFSDLSQKKPTKYILMDRLTIDFDHSAYEIRKENGKIKLLFVGSLDWAPNIDALEWFINEIFPLLKKENLYHFDIVGRDPSKKIIKKINTFSDITLHRNVPSIEEYYLNADIFVVPVRSGSGINIKVLEALSYGIPIVMTTFAKRGYDALNFIPSGDTPETFANEISRLKDMNVRADLSKQELLYYDNYQQNITLLFQKIFCSTEECANEDKNI